MGAVTAVKKLIKDEKTPVQMAANALKDKASKNVGQDEMEMAARRRGARRRGAMLMSDATLNQSNETLGGGNNLG
jgi:hypothetical protein